ncbi:hypothetical protein BVG16_27100 [Paenibacillus selenitireducens]|uniref:Uncharacterized protein n=1 Tax=Paenibacillus selenitireducens TaxID=1324314 RepID=A0A1T2X218_9BACL|nr:hypothetical protein [Paenibacillus selenitireducens]OPA73756.1 hypothetical protein BVG16_27100 [Paenibacillus selenitireducens]
MKKMNKKFIIFGLVAFILIIGTNAYTSGTKSSLLPNVSPEDQAMVKKVEDRLNQSWTKGREVILKSEEAKAFANSSDISGYHELTKWTIINDLNNDELLSSFSRKERSSFIDAFYSEERAKNLDVGDYMSALLINPDKSQALVYWEKANGSYVVMDLKTKSDDSNSWYVNGVKIENPK